MCPIIGCSDTCHVIIIVQKSVEERNTVYIYTVYQSMSSLRLTTDSGHILKYKLLGLYGIKSKAAINLAFNLPYKAIAAFLLCIVVLLYKNIARIHWNLPSVLKSSTRIISVSRYGGLGGVLFTILGTVRRRVDQPIVMKYYYNGCFCKLLGIIPMFISK